MFETLAECALCRERYFVKTQHGAIDAPVPAEGPIGAKILIIGRNPGKDEVVSGRPFVGRAGTKLNEALVLAGILRRECWVTNVAKCFTPQDVKPSRVCYRTCRKHWFDKEMKELKNLEFIITFGNVALQQFEPLAYVGMLHGTSFQVDTVQGRRELFVMYHPSAALRDSGIHQRFIGDVVKLHERLSELNLAKV